MNWKNDTLGGKKFDKRGEAPFCVCLVQTSKANWAMESMFSLVLGKRLRASVLVDYINVARISNAA